MRAAGVRTLRLTAKDGIALLNGTQAMCAVGGLALHRAVRLTAIADLAGAMTLDALLGSTTAFDERIHQVRPHQGQIHAACHFRRLLDGSEISRSRENKATHVQDAYSLRCMPQVHGAVRGALLHAVQIVEIESGAATDNPLVFPDTGEILNGGNFHGAPLSLAYDYAAIAMVSLMSIAERRIDRLLNPDINEGLPPFLSADPGTSCGYMIAHVCAVALLSEAKVLAHPASADSVPTSAGAEDHVSMGMTAALKLREVIRNAEQVTAIELLAAAEGLRYRAPLRSSMPIEEAVDLLRSLVPPLAGDRPLHRDIETVADAIRQGRFDTF
jgi:histidine ammonia-lyase